MAWSQFGDPAFGDWTPQADFDAQQSAHGGWNATQTFLIARASLDDSVFQNEFSFGRAATELDQNLEQYWAFLELQSIPRVRHAKGGYSFITVAFAGYGTVELPEGGDKTEPSYHLRGETHERNILEHHKVEALGLADRLILGGLYDGNYAMAGSGSVAIRVADQEGNETLNEIGTQPTPGDAADFAALIAQGVRTYKHPTFVWEKRWEDKEGISNADLNNLGQVDAPEGDPPSAQGGRDWMLTFAQQDQNGGVYSNALEWLLSEQGGHNTTLYT